MILDQSVLLQYKGDGRGFGEEGRGDRTICDTEHERTTCSPPTTAIRKEGKEEEELAFLYAFCIDMVCLGLQAIRAVQRRDGKGLDEGEIYIITTYAIKYLGMAGDPVGRPLGRGWIRAVSYESL